MKYWRARVIDAFFVQVVESFATALVHALIHGNTSSVVSGREPGISINLLRSDLFITINTGN